MVKRLLLLLFMSIFVAVANAQVETHPAPSETPTVSAPPSAFAQPHRAQKPIPLKWKLAVAATAVAFGAAILIYAARRWRTWNLFDRQYYFPATANAALRFGATKSGGCMATSSFGREKISASENL